MAEIILDCGSGNSCKNEIGIALKMIDEIIKIDTKKHKIIYKWQLFQKAGDNIPLKYEIFKLAYNYAQEKGYETTASVFDTYSLETLMWLEIPFIKIPCRPSLYRLIGEIPRRYKVYVSCIRDEFKYMHNEWGDNITLMECVPKYPAELEEYEGNEYLYYSDHTVGLGLWYRDKPEIWECHFCLDEASGLDAGPWCKRIKELKEIL